MMQIEGACVTEVMKLVEYVESKEDPLIQIGSDTPRSHKLNNVTISRNMQIKNIRAQKIKEKWQEKLM
jgi:hypothetical protein